MYTSTMLSFFEHPACSSSRCIALPKIDLICSILYAVIQPITLPIGLGSWRPELTRYISRRTESAGWPFEHLPPLVQRNISLLCVGLQIRRDTFHLGVLLYIVNYRDIFFHTDGQ